MTTEGIIRSALEFAILQYCFENNKKMIKGKLWPEKMEWMEHFDGLLSANNRAELRRLAVGLCQRNQSSDDVQLNIRSGLADEVTNDQLSAAFVEIKRVPDAKRADASGAIVKAALEASRAAKKRKRR